MIILVSIMIISVSVMIILVSIMILIFVKLILVYFVSLHSGHDSSGRCIGEVRSLGLGSSMSMQQL